MEPHPAVRRIIRTHLLITGLFDAAVAVVGSVNARFPRGAGPDVTFHASAVDASVVAGLLG